MGQVESYNNSTAYLRGLLIQMRSLNGKHLEKSETLPMQVIFIKNSNSVHWG